MTMDLGSSLVMVAGGVEQNGLWGSWVPNPALAGSCPGDSCVLRDAVKVVNLGCDGVGVPVSPVELLSGGVLVCLWKGCVVFAEKCWCEVRVTWKVYRGKLPQELCSNIGKFTSCGVDEELGKVGGGGGGKGEL
eukprot:134547-Amphidinium_carterae.1